MGEDRAINGDDSYKMLYVVRRDFPVVVDINDF